jgi:hypothetical protein
MLNAEGALRGGECLEDDHVRAELLGKRARMGDGLASEFGAVEREQDPVEHPSFPRGAGVVAT